MNERFFCVLCILAGLAVSAPAQSGVPAIHLAGYDTEDPCPVGKETIYVLEVRNEGTAAITNVLASGVPGKGMRWVDPPGAAREDGGIAFAAKAILSPGEKAVYRLRAKFEEAGAAKMLWSVGCDQCPLPLCVEESTTVTAERGQKAPALHASCYDTQDPCAEGGQTLYVFEVRNEGTAPMTDIVVTGMLGKGMEWVEGGGAPVDGKVSFAPRRILNPGAQAVYRLSVRLRERGVWKMRWSAACREIPSGVSVEEATTAFR